MIQKPFYEDPAAGQSSEEIEAFLRSREVGDEVAIHNPQGGSNLLNIKIATVTEVRPRGRLWTDKSADYGDNRWYVKTGKNCGAPTGQSRLKIPTDEVKRYAAEKRMFLDVPPFGS
tara:strand:+ start:641 stop:988 length:348 start_codon:yes stop_codon:yes gene_type:complete